MDTLDRRIKESLAWPAFGADFDGRPRAAATAGEPSADAMKAAFPRMMALNADVGLVLGVGLGFGGEFGIEVAGGGASGTFGMQADCEDESALGKCTLGQR